MVGTIVVGLAAGPVAAREYSNPEFWEALSVVPRQELFDCNVEIWSEEFRSGCDGERCGKRVWLFVEDRRFGHEAILLSRIIGRSSRKAAPHPVELFTSENARGLGWNRRIDLVLRTNVDGEVVALQMTTLSVFGDALNIGELSCSGHPRALKLRERGY